jgi:proline dehydrogenase
LPVLQLLREEHKGAILAYTAEVSEAAAMGKGLDHTSGLTPERSIVDELIHSIDVSADFEDGKTVNAADRRTWVAVKLVCPFVTLSSFNFV